METTKPLSQNPLLYPRTLRSPERPSPQYLNSWAPAFEQRLMVFCMGATCSGKSTFIDRCTESNNKFGSIKVGEEMRRRHPPEYFDGLGAMQHTEDEAWEIFTSSLDDNVRRGKSIVLVDGQPRLPSQVEKCFRAASERSFVWIILWFMVDEDELKRRMLERFKGKTGELGLAKERMVNDKCQLYDVFQSIFLWDKRYDLSTFIPNIVTPNTFDTWVRKLSDFDF